MKRSIILAGLIAVLLVGGHFTYYRFFGSPEMNRDRSLAEARNYLKESKINEAIIEFRNAVKADPRSSEARFEFGMTLMKRGDIRGSYQELARQSIKKALALNTEFAELQDAKKLLASLGGK